MKNIKYHTVATIPESNIKIVERGKVYTSNTQIYDRSLSCLSCELWYNIATNYILVENNICFLLYNKMKWLMLDHRRLNLNL
jgi:hypothetical protein